MISRSRDVTFVVSRSGNPTIFERNFASSPGLRGLPQDRFIIQEGFSSASVAYNDALAKAKTDLVIFAHQDVYFPEEWLSDFDHSLTILERSDPNWGVLGCWGVNNRGLQAGYLHSVGLGILGAPFPAPVPIDTLDEYILILRKSSGLKFDPTLPYFHFYGTDICMSARKNKMTSYAISAFTVHNTSYGQLAPEFFACYWFIKEKWKEFLPIQTPCIRVTRWNEDFLRRKFKRACFTAIGKDLSPIPRLEDPRMALGMVPQASDK